MYKHLPTQEHKPGQRYMFVENLPIPKKPGEPHGHIDAIDPLTAKKKWRVPLTDLNLVGYARDRRRSCSRENHRRVHRAQCRQWKTVMAIPDRFGHQCDAGHLHANKGRQCNRAFRSAAFTESTASGS
jgi:hypothetical protein